MAKPPVSSEVMSADDMKPLLRLARRRPVGCAIGLTRDKQGVILLHRRTKPRKLMAELIRQASGAGVDLDRATVRFGRATVDGASDSTMVRFAVNKEAPGTMSARLREKLRPAGLQRCEIVVNADLETESDEEEDGAGDDALDDAGAETDQPSSGPAAIQATTAGGSLPSHGARVDRTEAGSQASAPATPLPTGGGDGELLGSGVPSGITPLNAASGRAADPAAVPAGPVAGGKLDAKALVLDLTKVVKQELVPAIGRDPSRKAELLALANQAHEHIKAGDLQAGADGTAALHKALLPLTGAGPADGAALVQTVAAPALPPSGDEQPAAAPAGNPLARRADEDTPGWAGRLVDESGRLTRLHDIDPKAATAGRLGMNDAIAADPEFQRRHFAEVQGLTVEAFYDPARYGKAKPDRSIAVRFGPDDTVVERLQHFISTSRNPMLHMGADGVVYDFSGAPEQTGQPPSQLASIYQSNAELTNDLGEQIHEHGIGAVPPEVLGMAMLGGIGATRGIRSRGAGPQVSRTPQASGNQGLAHGPWTPKDVGGRRVYQRDDLIDPTKKDDKGQTNLQRMLQGDPPYGPDNQPLNIHHLTQDEPGSVAEMTQTFPSDLPGRNAHVLQWLCKAGLR